MTRSRFLQTPALPNGIISNDSSKNDNDDDDYANSSDNNTDGFDGFDSDSTDDDSTDDDNADDDNAENDSAKDDSAEDDSADAKTNEGNANKRQSYSREYKLAVLDWHHRNGSVKNKTARHFAISRQNVVRWVRAEIDIRKAKKGSKRGGKGRTATNPFMERRLHEEFLELRSKGVKIRNIWFLTR